MPMPSFSQFVGGERERNKMFVDLKERLHLLSSLGWNKSRKRKQLEAAIACSNERCSLGKLSCGY